MHKCHIWKIILLASLVKHVFCNMLATNVAVIVFTNARRCCIEAFVGAFSSQSSGPNTFNKAPAAQICNSNLDGL